MNILIISSQLPMPDRASGELRFFSILAVLSKKHNLTLAISASNYQKKTLGNTVYSNYETQLKKHHISISTQPLNTIKSNTFDCIFFEFYHSCKHTMDIVRFYQSSAVVIVDSVDVHFKRLEAKAKLTQHKNDVFEAAKVKKEELHAYRNSDIVIAVTGEDQKALQLTCPKTQIVIIPNIHKIPDFAYKKISTPVKLLFIGGFNHPPNIDAMLFFCHEVMPLLRTHLQGIHLSIVGSSPTEEILSLKSHDIEVTGFVPSVTPYYAATDIVIAPLRYGGGMKGKVGEAFSFSRPVITTTFGAEGFDITPNTHYLLAQSAEEYLNAIIKLNSHSDFTHKIVKNAWQYIHDNYSDEKAAFTINTIFDDILNKQVKKLNFFKRISFIYKNFLNQHILWRFK